MKGGTRQLAALMVVALAVIEAQAGSQPATASTISARRAGPTGVAAKPLDTLYITNGDHVHITAGQASGHGWWEKVGGTASTAKVTIWLEEYLGGKWYVEAEGTHTGGPGSGSGKWANARYTCIPTATTYPWRSRIDVDIIGEQDAPDQAITATQHLKCL